MFPTMMTEMLGCFQNTDSVKSNRFIEINRAYGATANAPKNSKKYIRSNTNATNIHIGHELSLFLTLESVYWNVSQRVDDGVPDSERITTTKFRQMSPAVFLRYSYNIPFSKNFGFFLGSTAGMIFASMDQNNFHSGYGIFFPTILIGFTGSPTPADRITIATEYGATWYPEMSVETEANLKRPLNATLDAWDLYASNDYFFYRDIAFNVTVGVRAINNVCKLKFLCSNANYINTLKIRNTTYYGQIGFVFGDLR